MERTLDDIAKKMRDMDFAMLSTHGEGGAIAARPMSNNRDVDYDGDSWFFADDGSHMVAEIVANPSVSLGYQGSSGLLGQRPFFLAVAGRASIIRDKAAFADHWKKELERWWPDGIDTPGLVLIRVSGGRLHYWDGEDEGEMILSPV